MVHQKFDSDKFVTGVKNHCARPELLLDLVKLNLLYGLLASRDLKQNSVIADSFLRDHLMCHELFQRITFFLQSSDVYSYSSFVSANCKL